MFSKIPFLILMFIFSISIQAQDVFDAARNGDLEAMNLLYEADSNCINLKNSQNYNPLILACYYDQLEFVEFLIEKKVLLNLENNSATALQAATYKGSTKIVSALLKYGADPNIVDANGTSPLIYATQFQHYEILKLLLKYQADQGYKDLSGNTALDYAEKLKIEKAIKILKLKN